MNEIIFLIEEDPEGEYIATAIGEDIITDGDTMQEIKENVKDAVECHFEVEKRPKLIRLQMVKEEVIVV